MESDYKSKLRSAKQSSRDRKSLCSKSVTAKRHRGESADHRKPQKRTTARKSESFGHRDGRPKRMESRESDTASDEVDDGSSCDTPALKPGKTLQSLRQIAGKFGVPMSGNKSQITHRIQWYKKYNLNSSIIGAAPPVKAVDESSFIDDLLFKSCDQELQHSLKWLTVVEAFSYFQKRSARQGYRNGKLLRNSGFLRNVCYAKDMSNKILPARMFCKHGTDLRKMQINPLCTNQFRSCIWILLQLILPK
ncbi:uncharacterized protein LOC134291112 [Aedes albopictus]|uniref:SAP domain-containing protein n=1 Tax=Aedes albopictus TaxID=7160 RepID=A0ABM1ZC74_AEDAL